MSKERHGGEKRAHCMFEPQLALPTSSTLWGHLLGKSKASVSLGSSGALPGEEYTFQKISCETWKQLNRCQSLMNSESVTSVIIL